MPPLKYRGARALVTGASSGIGLALARALAERGVAELWLVARRRERLEALAAELARDGTTCHVLPADLAEPAELERVAERAAGVDLLLPMAGFGSGLPFGEREPSWYDRMVDVNCRAVVRLLRAGLPAMAERGHGGALLPGSLSALLPMPSMSVYAASKAFVHALADGLRAEYPGLHLTVLAPGPVSTEFFSTARPGAQRPSERHFLRPERVAEEALEAWRAGRPLCIPGRGVRLAARLARSLPGPARRRALAAAYRRAAPERRKA